MVTPVVVASSAVAGVATVQLRLVELGVVAAGGRRLTTFRCMRVRAAKERSRAKAQRFGMG